MKKMLDNYKTLYQSEAIGHQSYGIEILVSCDHDFTDGEKHAAYEAKNTIEDVIKAGNASTSIEAQDTARRMRSGLLSLFGDPEFVEEIPNGYCSRGCCRHLPWFRVMTRIGPIEIGWRKSVVYIDWSKTMLKTRASELFPESIGGYPTAGDYYIHAYGIEKAQEYVRRLVEAKPINNREHDLKDSNPSPHKTAV